MFSVKASTAIFDLQTWNWGWFAVGLVLAVLVIIGALALNGAFRKELNTKGAQLTPPPQPVTLHRRPFAQAHPVTPTQRPSADRRIHKNRK